MTRRNRFILVAFIAFLAVDIALLIWWFTRPTYSEPPLSFDGSSDLLQHTVIVPTLDTPIPEGKNAIWCASFQVAWNKLKTEVAKGPVLIQGAEEIADRLNKSPVTEADLPEGSYYAAAGLEKDGIIERIKREMGQEFPMVPPPTFSEVWERVAVAYAYMKAGVDYEIPYDDFDQGWEFEDSAGKGTMVFVTGIRERDAHSPRGNELRSQVRVIYCAEGRGVPQEYVIDPSMRSTPNQLLLARLQRRGTLAELLVDLDSKIRQAPPGVPENMRSGELLIVPWMNWRIQRRYAEIEGVDKPIQNPVLEKCWFGHAEQLISFRLDRRGSSVESESKLDVVKDLPPRMFAFDRPFLIVLRKRDAANPFFVMWVGNAELLQKWER
jgi:hypothetical protein